MREDVQQKRDEEKSSMTGGEESEASDGKSQIVNENEITKNSKNTLQSKNTMKTNVCEPYAGDEKYRTFLIVISLILFFVLF